MGFNLLHFMWLGYSFIVTFSGLYVLYGKTVPFFFRRLYAFGKVNKSINKEHVKGARVPHTKKSSFVGILEIPKRWFTHFYIFATIYIPVIMISVFAKYYGYYSNPLLNHLLDLCASPERKATVDAESVVIVSILLSLQVSRRCYECLFISVFSDSKMNVLHYIVGFTFYFGIGLSLIHDAPGFESSYDKLQTVYIRGSWFLWRHVLGSLLFFAAFVLQFQSHKAFASLRKKGEKVISENHYMPVGGGFSYVSCPHYFAEIVMYLSASLILGGKSYTWWLACLWTVTNQVLTGLMNHQWYKEKFKNYPPERKAVIPYLL